MKKIFFSIAFILGICSIANAQKYFDKAKIGSNNDSLSYAIGLVMAQNFIEQNIKDINPTIIGKAIKDVYENKSPLFDEEKANELIRSYFEKKKQKQKEEALVKENEFMAKNAKEPGVITTESGLQYYVIKEGNGRKPDENCYAKVYYEGKLLSGEVFDSSFGNEEPTKLDLEYIIPGMAEGLMLMSEGAEYKLFIPSKLGYDDYEVDDYIPAYSTLIFDVVLDSVEEKTGDENEDKE